MTIHEFGTENTEIILLIHPSGVKWDYFENVIPLSVKVAEASAEGKSIYCHCPNGKVSMAYENLTQEVLENEK